MQHQLVLQFRRSSIEGNEPILALESGLREILAAGAELDGHDTGSRFVNVFVLTPDASSTFRRAKPVLDAMQLLDKVTAAHRVVGGSLFKVIWPLRVRRKFSLD